MLYKEKKEETKKLEGKRKVERQIQIKERKKERSIVERK